MPTITVIDKPSSNLGPTAESSAAQAAKARAIAALQGAGQQTGQPATPQNQQAIAPEEVSKANTGEKPIEEDEKSLDTAPEATEETPKKEEPALSTQYAVLARKEKALRQKELAFQQTQRQKEAEWAARDTKPAAVDSTKYISIDDLKRSPYQKLIDLGVSYDEISAQALQAQSPEYQTIRQMREEIKQELQQLKDEQANIKKSSVDQQTQAYQQAVKQIEIEAKQLVYTDPAYDTIKNTNSVKQVVKLIESTFKETGELLSVERAAELVEEELVEQGAQYAQLQKIKARLAKAQANNEKQPANQPKQPGAKQMTTLTNAVTNTRPLSARERALLAFKNELK